jgi:hypothetical protein
MAGRLLSIITRDVQPESQGKGNRGKCLIRDSDEIYRYDKPRQAPARRLLQSRRMLTHTREVSETPAAEPIGGTVADGRPQTHRQPILTRTAALPE